MIRRLIALCLATATLATSQAQAKTYYDYSVKAENGAVLPGAFMMNDNCGGCPKGEAAGIAPGVLEYLLAQEDSAMRNHYAKLAQYRHGEIEGFAKKPVQSWNLIGGTPPAHDTSKNSILQVLFEGDVKNLVDSQQAFLYQATGGSDYMTVLAGAKDGVLLARAVAKETSAAANEMIAKKSRAQYLWGYKWNEDDGTWTTPTVGGAVITLLVPNEAENTVVEYHFSMKLGKPVNTWDLSGVAGAFDPSGTVSYDDVAASIKKK